MNETPNIHQPSIAGRFFHWLFSRRVQGRALIGLAALGTLAAVFYLEEDWRGWHAWQSCKRELEAKGMVLDWDKYIPAPAPDGQNFFTASTNILLRFKKAQTDAESELARKCTWLRIGYSTNSFPVFDTAQTGPLVVAELTVGPSNITSAAASGIQPFVVKLNAADAHEQVQDLIHRTVGRSIPGAAGFKFSERQLSKLAPAQIILQSDRAPSVADLENLIPEDLITNVGHLRIEAAGNGKSFRVLLTGAHITAAADYLEWSDQFGPALDEVREALKRSYALLPGDYSQPYAIPIPNFITMRAVAQLLAQRAQCHMLLGQPDEAAREIMFMRDVCRILEKPPTGKPETLVEAMINVAICGLYANTIADGFHLRAWQAPQLTALQAQLKTVNALPPVVEAFQTLPAAECRNLEIMPLAKLFSVGNPRMGWLAKAGLWLVPRGWVYQNIVNLAVLQQKPLNGFAPADNTVAPRLFDEAARAVSHSLARKSPYNFLTAIAIPNFVKAQQVTAYNQTLVNEAQIACALERYRLAHGEYPETLGALTPQFIEKLPHDIIGGQPLHYRRTDDGKFALYSVGWNETDDNGKESPPNPNGGFDYSKGDWVWKNGRILTLPP